MVETWYEVGNKYKMMIAVLVDIHAERIKEVFSLLEQSKTDIILIPGDLVDGAKIEKSKNHNSFVNLAIFI